MNLIVVGVYWKWRTDENEFWLIKMSIFGILDEKIGWWRTKSLKS